MANYVAVAFGKDGVEGDSYFNWAFSVPCDECGTFDQMLSKWLALHGDLIEDCDCDVEGFWVVDAERYAFLEDVMQYAADWNDSMMDGANEQGKRWLDANSAKYRRGRLS